MNPRFPLKWYSSPAKKSFLSSKAPRLLSKLTPQRSITGSSAHSLWGVLQNKEIPLESRMLLLNYAVKTVQGMIDQGQPNLIPRFIERFVMDRDYEKTLKFFEGLSFVPAFSLADGISLLKAVKKTTPAFKEVMAEVYKNLGVSGPETLNLVDMNKYVKMREKVQR